MPAHPQEEALQSPLLMKETFVHLVDVILTQLRTGCLVRLGCERQERRLMTGQMTSTSAVKENCLSCYQEETALRYNPVLVSG